MRAVTSATSSSCIPSSSTPASCSRRTHHRVAQRALARRSTGTRSARSPRPRSATARTVSARQSQIGELVEEIGARGDDALACLGRPLAAQRTVVPATRWRGVGRGAHGTTTGSVSQPRTVEVGAKRAPSSVDVPLGEPLQQLVERDAAFEAGERGAEAEVDAVAEGEVLADLAVDVEAVAVGEAAVVAVGRRRRGTAWRCPRGPSARGARRRGPRSGRRAAPGGSKRRSSSIAFGISERSSTSSRRWSGCSASTLPAQPMRRVVVSLPAPATTVT